ncbi:hypothetical protein C2G38_2104659 [Gigaspora rosea]|uniref:Uncharacterized protein n=1 Tax=Gigaspora rosea TaxID=44941 RepID=A0A397UL67_9GLOM|nr:hypothetical protein C2G38_2104659 [Gigaspora rosea]
MSSRSIEIYQTYIKLFYLKNLHVFKKKIYLFSIILYICTYIRMYICRSLCQLCLSNN